VTQNFLCVIVSFLFALKAEFEVLKEYCQVKLGLKQRTNLHGKISLVLLEYG